MPSGAAAARAVDFWKARQSSPNFGFGTSDRSHQAKVYMSPEHEKMNHGLQSPGPATYGLNGSVGVQRLSKDHSSASW